MRPFAPAPLLALVALIAVTGPTYSAPRGLAGAQEGAPPEAPPEREDAPREEEGWLPGAQAVTPAGRIPIERVRAGDRVLARDETTGAVRYGSVTRVVRGRAARSMALRVAEVRPGPRAYDPVQTLRCTPGTRLWVEGIGWLPASRLRVGQRLLGPTRERLLITAHEEHPERRETVALEIDGAQAYFVAGQARDVAAVRVAR